jgi:hypothetical protein
MPHITVTHIETERVAKGRRVRIVELMEPSAEAADTAEAKDSNGGLHVARSRRSSSGRKHEQRVSDSTHKR